MVAMVARIDTRRKDIKAEMMKKTTSPAIYYLYYLAFILP